MTYTAIGFANKFYTLWTIEEETRPLGNGCNYVVTHYNYIKNISFDRETALAKYPEATFDETLRGMTRSWSSKPKEVWTDDTVFRFGKYKYDSIENSSDTNYIAWYYGQISDGDHKDFITKVLESRGFEFRTCTYMTTDYTTSKEYEKSYIRMMTPEDLLEEKKEQEKLEELIKKANEGTPVEIEISYNPDEEGLIRCDGILYKFPEVKENWYNGFIYYTPVVNGVGKRVKNKTIIATIEHQDDKFIIKDFKIKK